MCLNFCMKKPPYFDFTCTSGYFSKYLLLFNYIIMIQNQKICLITGATSGIGLVTALELARMNYHLILVARNKEKVEETIRYIRHQTICDKRYAISECKIDYFLCDLANLDEVRNVADKIGKKYPSINILINNAGIFIKDHSVTKEGCETQLAVNYLSPFLLTNLLLPNLKNGLPSRIINVSSLAHKNVSLNLENMVHRKLCENPEDAYASSKLALIMFTYQLAEKMKNSGITVNAVCPGGVATDIWRHNKDIKAQIAKISMSLLKTPEQAARILVYLATSPELEKVTGKYFAVPSHSRFIPYDVKKCETKSSPESYDQKKSQQLWEISEKLVGIS